MMGFVSMALPSILYATDKLFDVFFLSYMGIIEVLLLVAVLISKGKEYLNYEQNIYGRLIIKTGLFKSRINISTEKVEMVHVEKKHEDFEIVILCNSKFKNKKIKEVNLEFLKENAYLSHYYEKLKKKSPEKQFYYIIISNGGYLKYELLDLIYRSCVHAFFTEEAIYRIKEYRNK